MLVAIGALLGIPLWILIGWLAGALWHRHEIKGLPGQFKANVCLVSGLSTGIPVITSLEWLEMRSGPTMY